MGCGVSTVWRIFLRDVRRILRNPVALVVTLGVALIPSLYAWFNIVANWNPYGNTGNIQVAVANEDAGADNELTGHLDAGGQVVEQLKANTELGWRFVPTQEAIEGVHAGTYYAAIVIPKDFSADLLGTITGGSPRPTIQYYVNEKKNAIAPKITDTGATTIDRQINQTFVSTVAGTVAKEVEAAGGLAKDQAGQTRDQVLADLDSVGGQLADARTSIAAVSKTAQDGVATVAAAKDAIGAMDGQITSINDALNTAGTLLSNVRSASGSFTGAVDGAMNLGAAKLSGLAVATDTVGGAVYGGFATAQNTVDDVTHTVSAAIDTQRAVRDALQNLLDNGAANGTLPEGDPLRARIQDQIDRLNGDIASQQSRLDDFSTTAGTLITAGKDATVNLTNATSGTTSAGIIALNASRDALNNNLLPGLANGLDAFAATTGTLSGTIAGLDGTLGQASALLDQLSNTLTQTHATLQSTDAALAGLETTVGSVRTDVAAIDSSAAYLKIQDALNLDQAGIGDFMGAPVQLENKIIYPSLSYGSAVTPFYTNLALWVGGFVLIAIYKLEVDRDREFDGFSATQAYMGRWLLFMTIGAMQAVIVTLGDLVLGVQRANAFLFVLAGLVISFVYVNIIYAMAAAFRHIGKALAVVLVIVQIPGAAGMYPIEMMPGFFRNLKPFLPFTYGINAMREALGGMYGNHYWRDLGILLCYVPIALFTGLVVRRASMNLNALFDRRLLDTDLMITEKDSVPDERVDLSRLIHVFMADEGYRTKLRHRANRFFGMYPKLIRGGLVLICVLPFLFLVLLFVIDQKMLMLSLWIASIVAIDAYLIVVEYVRDRFARQLGMSEMTPEQFRSAMASGLMRHHHLHLGLAGLSGLVGGGSAGRHAAGQDAGQPGHNGSDGEGAAR